MGLRHIKKYIKNCFNNYELKKHTKFVTVNLRKVIYKASQILNDFSLNYLYYYLFYYHLGYCSDVWGTYIIVVKFKFIVVEALNH